MNRPNLNTLSKEVYQANKEKGFHDKEHSNETCLMLVITELSEAVEADRKGKRADIDSFNLLSEKSKSRTGNPNYFNEIAFCRRIKDTVEDELADAVIRLLDLAGLRVFIIRDYSDRETTYKAANKNYGDKNFAEIIMAVTRTLAAYGKDVSIIINQAILSIEWICEHLSIDLWLHVELKLKYNQSRPYKHGKAY